MAHPDDSAGEQPSHGQHAKETTITVNGRDRTVTSKELTYEDLLPLAFNPVPTGPNVLITVTYRKGENGKQGSLVAGSEPVKVHEKMIFNVTATDKS